MLSQKFSQKDLVDIFKEEIENKLREEKLFELPRFNYILLDGTISPKDNMDTDEQQSTNIYALVYRNYDETATNDYYYDDFIFHSNFDFPLYELTRLSLQKAGFVIKEGNIRHYPTPNLKYLISYGVVFYDHPRHLIPEYLSINVFDFDDIAKSFGIPQLVELKLDNKTGELSKCDVIELYTRIKYEEPILAGYSYKEAWNILARYFLGKNEKWKEEATRIVEDYYKLFQKIYRKYYKWKDAKLVEIEINPDPIYAHFLKFLL